MACKTCTSGGCSTAGCNSNSGCASGGCNKMNTFDWLSGMLMDAPAEVFPFVEVRFKGGRKEYYKNAKKLLLHTGDAVVIELPTGIDLGFVSLQGELVKLQMKKRGIVESDDTPVIARLATNEEITKYEAAKSKEMSTLYRTREIAKELNLEMKLSDVEFQMDGKKATFYYSADDRVDFRELIKILANEFKVRVEMKQISLRQEAGRLGGIGVCGRELCCSTWLTDFKSVNTSAARYQNLSLNPQKLSGQCGRLKCCLNYELDTYMDSLKDIPEVEKPIKTKMGDAKLQKTDIFRKLMWFSFNDEANWHKLTTEEVAQLLRLNAQGLIPNSLNPNDVGETEALVHLPKRNTDIEKLDQKFKSKNRHHKPKHGRR